MLTVTPKNQELDLLSDEDILLECQATSDDSTPITYQWERDGRLVKPEEGRIEILDDNTLR